MTRPDLNGSVQDDFLTWMEEQIAKRKGGRGRCLKCGKMQNNVSYHQEHECGVTDKRGRQ